MKPLVSAWFVWTPLNEGLDSMSQKHYDLILVNVGQQSMDGSQIVRRIQVRAKELFLRCPQIILLSTAPMPLEEAAKCRGIQAMCMLRQYAPPIYEEVRVRFWMRQIRTRGSTIRIDNCHGHYYLDFCLGVFSSAIEVGHQPAKLAAIMAGGLPSYHLETLADELEVCRQSVKKYIWELRQGSLRAQERLQIYEPDYDVFWMARGTGGTRCGIKATVVWG